MTAKRYLCVVYKARLVYFRIWVPSSLFTILPGRSQVPGRQVAGARQAGRRCQEGRSQVPGRQVPGAGQAGPRCQEGR